VIFSRTFVTIADPAGFFPERLDAIFDYVWGFETPVIRLFPESSGFFRFTKTCRSFAPTR
jgi:hypothetical protein